MAMANHQQLHFAEEEIEILDSHLVIPYQTAIINPLSPDNTITLETLINLLGPDVEYVKAGNSDPHGHGNGELVGTKLLEIESTECEGHSEEVFCILSKAVHPIVLKKSLKPLKDPGRTLPIVGRAATKKDEQLRKEALDKAKKREEQRIKENEPRLDRKHEEERNQMNQAAQTQTK